MPLLLDLPRIYFDFGAVGALPSELARLHMGRPLFMTDRSLVECGVLNQVMSTLPSKTVFPVFDETPENPTVAGVEKAREIYMNQGCDGVIAVGGGSVIDSSKALALRSVHPAPIAQYERHPEKVTKATTPIIAIPTTAGTGSEVTSGAGIHPDPSTPSFGLSSPFLIPKVAICDPLLTMTLPPKLTAGTGMDALGQCVEAYLAKGNNPIIDAIALDGAQRAFKYVERAVVDGSDKEARWHMMMAALEGGIGIHKGLGSAHAIAIALSDQGFHHGILVTIALPVLLLFLEGRIGDRMIPLAKALGLNDGSQVAPMIERLNSRIGLPATLRSLGYSMGDVDRVAQLCVDSFFNETAPCVPTLDEYKRIVADTMG